MIYLISLLVALLVILRFKRQSNVVSFFHPYCNAGGGGERVLWCAIRAMQQRWPSLRYVVFSGDRDASKEQILLKAKQRFGIEVDPNNVEFVFLRLRRLVEADLYPRFTLIFQTLAGGILALEALLKLNAGVFIDSMGYPLSLPVFRWLGGATVGAYVHYPTISCDMIEMVSRREASYNNNVVIANSSVLSKLKLFYYKSFAYMYALCGRASNFVMTNGSWCQGHITRLWSRQDAKVVFPPCDVTSFIAIETLAEQILSSSKTVHLLSIGQIRPEKNHKLQIDILKGVREKLSESGSDIEVKLTIAGGCRHQEDRDRVESLKEYANEQNVSEYIQWKLNVPYDELLELLSESLISLHTMRNEHFGISVVEGMAAGTVMLAHNSAGPSMDIVVSQKKGQNVGYLAATCDEYVSAVLDILSLTPAKRDALRNAARSGMSRFSDETFEKQWNETVQEYIHI